MAAKRYLDESGSDPDDQPSEKRMRTGPSLTKAFGEVVMANSLEKYFCSALEPLLRRVVKEEMESGLRRCARSLMMSPPLPIQALEPSTFQLVFSKELLLPIFTGTRILDFKNTPLQILLVDTKTSNQMIPTINNLPHHPIKVEIVVLDGDFPSRDCNTWSSEEFNNKIVKERTGKRPLLTGDLVVTLRDGSVQIGDIEFTDNSSWIRSRKFRLGARVATGSCEGVKIREAMTEAFVVKDHRGELYKKHHPPMLDDEVWRLEKIGKDGVFHRKLASHGINTVQDFLKLSVIDPSKLRKILGIGMSERVWEATIKHARTCVMGSKLYMWRGPHYTIFLNPICQVVRATINGQTYSSQDRTSISKMIYIEKLVREANCNWNSLEVVDGLLTETALLTQGGEVDQCPSQHHQTMVKSLHQNESPTYKSMEARYLPINEHVGSSSDWAINSTYLSTPVVESDILYNFSESSSDNDVRFKVSDQ